MGAEWIRKGKESCARTQFIKKETRGKERKASYKTLCGEENNMNTCRRPLTYCSSSE